MTAVPASGGIALRGMTWSDPRGYEPVLAVSAAFAEHNPGVRLDWDRRSLQDFESFPLDLLAATYDLMVIDHPHVGQAAAEGCLVRLDEALPPARLAAVAADGVGPSFASYRWQGHVWALPIDASAPVQAIRPDLVDAPATRWEEVVRHAAAGRVLWPLRSPHALTAFFSLAANRGTPCAAEPGPRLIARDAGRAVLDALLRVTRRLDPVCWDLDPIAGLDLLASEADRFALIPLVYGYRNYMTPGYRRQLVRFADMPCVGEAGPVGSCLGGTGIAVSARSRHAVLACRFAAFCADAAIQRTLYAANGGQPASAAAWDDEAVDAAAGGFYRAVRRTLDGAWLRPRRPGLHDFPARGLGGPGRNPHRPERCGRGARHARRRFRRELPGLIRSSPDRRCGLRTRPSPGSRPAWIARMLATQRSPISRSAASSMPAACGASTTLSSRGEASQPAAPGRTRRGRHRRSGARPGRRGAPPRRSGRRARC